MSFDSDIKPGQELSNEDIIRTFKCGARGGMRRSRKTNTLVIISDPTKPYYSDIWENNIFHYTGMGQTGNQQLTFSQNRTLNESNTNNVDVHLFEVFEEGKFVYQGKVKPMENPTKKHNPILKAKIEPSGSSR